MNTFKAIGMVAAAVSLVAPAAALAAKPRLDSAFGTGRGYWVRTDGAWRESEHTLPDRGGSALVSTGDGRVMRIATNGRPDRGWGAGGVVDVSGGGPPGAGPGFRGSWSTDMARWNGRFLLSTQIAVPNLPRGVLVVDVRGRRLAVTSAVNAALPQDPRPSVGFFGYDRLVPAPGGKLWDLRSLTNYDGKLGITHFRRLYRLKADGHYDIGVPVPEEVGDAAVSPAVASGDGLLVLVYDPERGDVLRRVTARGTLDPSFAALTLGRGEPQLLPWHGGAVVLTSSGVRWVDRRGHVVHAQPVANASAAAFDTARRLLVVGTSTDTKSLTVERFTATGQVDRRFGEIRLRAAGRLVQGIGTVAAPGGKVLVIGRTIIPHKPESRDDLDYRVVGTIVWRLRTR
jgi:hypothetical protein